MKKFIISAVMALLIGGFAFTANAQGKDDEKKTQAPQLSTPAPAPKLDNKTDKGAIEGQQKAAKKAEEKAQAEKESKEITTLITNFESKVDQCIKERKNSKSAKSNFSKYLDEAQALNAQIEKYKKAKKLNDTQKEKYEIVYTKKYLPLFQKPQK